MEEAAPLVGSLQTWIIEKEGHLSFIFILPHLSAQSTPFEFFFVGTDGQRRISNLKKGEIYMYNHIYVCF